MTEKLKYQLIQRPPYFEARFKSEGEHLQRAVREAGLKASGNLYWARFDPPWKPGFLKQNEVLIDLEGLHIED